MAEHVHDLSYLGVQTNTHPKSDVAAPLPSQTPKLKLVEGWHEGAIKSHPHACSWISHGGFYFVMELYSEVFLVNCTIFNFWDRERRTNVTQNGTV